MNIDAIIDYENGDLAEDEIIELFQELIDTGQAWTLQGHYGRTAQALIHAGLCSEPPEPEPDTSGHYPADDYAGIDDPGVLADEFFIF